jgi:hypothetical protein
MAFGEETSKTAPSGGSDQVSTAVFQSRKPRDSIRHLIINVTKRIDSRQPIRVSPADFGEGPRAGASFSNRLSEITCFEERISLLWIMKFPVIETQGIKRHVIAIITRFFPIDGKNRQRAAIFAEGNKRVVR